MKYTTDSVSNFEILRGPKERVSFCILHLCIFGSHLLALTTDLKHSRGVLRLSDALSRKIVIEHSDRSKSLM
jgi:hypothetical protein